MKASELRTKTDSELKEELLALRKEQFNLRMQRGIGQLAKPDQFSKVKKSIARIKTVINERNKANTAQASESK